MRDKATAALKDVENGLRRNRREFRDLNKEADEWNVQAVKSKGATKGLGGSFGSLGGAVTKFAGPLAAATGGLVLFQQGLQKTIELNEKLADYQAVQGDLRQSIENTGLGAQVAEGHFESMRGEIRDVSEDVGASVTELSAAMRELTTRTDTVEDSSKNLNRILALSHQSGKDYTEVAKALGQAITGDLGPLKEMGILSDAQIQNFKGMADRGEGVARALDVLDQKTRGFAKGLPESAKAAGRLDASLERLEVAFSDLVGVDEIVGGMATAVEGAAGWVEEFVEAWEKAPERIRDVGKEIDKLPKKEGEEGAGEIDTDSYEFRRDLQKKLIKGAKWQADQRRRLIKESNLGWAREEAALERVNQLEQDRIAEIRERYQVERVGTTANLDAKIKLAELERDILEAKSEQERFDLKTQKLLQEIYYQRQKDLNAAAAEAEREKLRTFYSLKVNNLLRKRGDEWDRIAESREKATETDQGLSEEEMERRKADIRFEAQQRLQERLADLRAERRKENRQKAIEAMRARYDAEIDEIKRTHDEWLEGHRERTRETLDAVAARRETLTSSFEIGGFTQAGADLIGQYNDRLAEQVSLVGDLSSEVGTMAGAIDEAFNKQWDFGKAVDATTAGIDALATAGGAAAGILGDSVKEQAAIRAAFEAASAAAAAAAAYFFPANPGFWASAAQHGVAAGMFGIIAGTAPNVKTGSGASGGSAGGGSTSPSIRAGIDQRAAFESMKRANLEALREARREARVVNNYNFQGATLLDGNVATQRRVDAAMQRRRRLQLGGGRA
ncbi:hypothetical protein FIV42_00665 [Persicimonas caeni]|uniref:Uncharacterized protein n=1 Tax=Persicimonas caeni TaxID=2292766 RepID=A0A4Y6PLV7_PERCE|nr:hypothetical protein [Persicimonas caeni]QDG49296.1 hypothetical protein FIV42_00665 [Persicimonas caeni]QED30517.1 hypothetical protein FRD00_00660 [Persicimonas caeni]